MSGNGRSSDAYLTLLEKQGEEMNFFQTVRMLERAVTHPKNIRYKVINSEAFHPNFIAGVSHQHNHTEQQTTVAVNGYGTTGTQGPIPHCYAEMLQRALVRGAKGKEDPHGFLDIFHDRIIALLYAIKKRFNPMLFNELPKQHPLYTFYSSICGFSQLNLFDRLPVPAEQLVCFAPVLANRRGDYSSIVNVLKRYLGYPIKVTPNQGAWKALPAEFQAKLGKPISKNNDTWKKGLGRGLGLGKKYWDSQAAIKLEIHVPDMGALVALLPDGEQHKQLHGLTSFLVDAKYQYLVKLHISWSRVPSSKLEANSSMRLGRTSWLKSENHTTISPRTTGFTLSPEIATKFSQLGEVAA